MGIHERGTEAEGAYMIVNIAGYDVLIDNEDYSLFLMGSPWNKSRCALFAVLALALAYILGGRV